MNDKSVIEKLEHDLKNPLGGLSLNLQAALRRLTIAETNSETIKISALKGYLERAEQSNQRLQIIIEELFNQKEGAALAMARHESKTAPQNAKAKKILIVDDDEAIGETISDALRERGFQVEWVRSAERGLELLEAQKNFSLAIVDYHLPGMSGDAFAENSKIPVIIWSAARKIQQIKRTGFIEATLSKLSDLDELIHHVERIVQKSGDTNLPPQAIHSYLVRRMEDLRSCIKALEIEDYQSIHSIAHRVKGSASTFGFSDLSEIADKLEIAASLSDLDTTKKGVFAFEAWTADHPPMSPAEAS